MKLKREPQDAHTPKDSSDEAWWYEDKHHISVVIRRPDSITLQCKIPRHKLADWLARSKP